METQCNDAAVMAHLNNEKWKMPLHEKFSAAANCYVCGTHKWLNFFNLLFKIVTYCNLPSDW